MINKERTTVTETYLQVVSVTCDVCKKTYTKEDDYYEIQEFTYIYKNCGYGSVFGDEDIAELDICQSCLQEKLGKYTRITAGEDK